MITAIVCIGKNFEIGKKNGLLFNIKADMAHFRATTANSIIVVGENTLLSFPGSKPLKNRSTIVLCPEGHEYETCICVHDFNELVKMLKVLSITQEIFVCGGAMLYRSLLPYCDKAIITEVDTEDNEATAFFPNIRTEADFVLADRGEIQTEDQYKFSINTYTRSLKEI